MEHILIDPSGMENSVQVVVEKFDRFDFAFDPADVLFIREGNDLLLQFDGGGRIYLRSFFDGSSRPWLPTFRLADGTFVNSLDFLKVFEEDLNTEICFAGNDVPFRDSGHFYDDWPVSLIQGVDVLDLSQQQTVKEPVPVGSDFPVLFHSSTNDMTESNPEDICQVPDAGAEAPPLCFADPGQNDPLGGLGAFVPLEIDCSVEDFSSGPALTEGIPDLSALVDDLEGIDIDTLLVLLDSDSHAHGTASSSLGEEGHGGQIAPLLEESSMDLGEKDDTPGNDPTPFREAATYGGCGCFVHQPEPNSGDYLLIQNGALFL